MGESYRRVTETQIQGKKREGFGGRNTDLSVALSPTLQPKFFLGEVPVYQVWGHLEDAAVLSPLLSSHMVNMTAAW